MGIKSLLIALLFSVPVFGGALSPHVGDPITNIKEFRSWKHDSADLKSALHSDGTTHRFLEALKPKREGILGTDEVEAPSGKKFSLTVITPKLAKELFEEMASQKDIPFRYPEDGCYARAHAMAMRLKEKGVITGKTYIEGDLRVETTNSPKGYVKWWYHVAPIVMVKDKGKTEAYVIDPSIFDHPVPVEEWYAIQTKHPGGSRDATYMTKRFNYHPSDKTADLGDFRKTDLDDTDSTMKSYLKIQEERDQKKIDDFKEAATKLWNTIRGK